MKFAIRVRKHTHRDRQLISVTLSSSTCAGQLNVLGGFGRDTVGCADGEEQIEDGDCCWAETVAAPF